MGDSSSSGGDTSDMDNFSNMDNFSQPTGQNYSAATTGNMGMGMVDDFGAYSSVTADNVSKGDLSQEAMGTLGPSGSTKSDQYSNVFGASDGRDYSDFSRDIDADDDIEEAVKKGSFKNVTGFPSLIGTVLNQFSKIGAQNTLDNLDKGFAPTYSKGSITGTTGLGIGMGSPDGAVEGYGAFDATSPSMGMYGGSPDIGGGESDERQLIRRNPNDPVQVNPTDPVLSDDLAVNYLQDPYYLYSGINNLYQPYGYAQGTLVDLLRTRNLTQPQQRAANLGLFGNPGDFS